MNALFIKWLNRDQLLKMYPNGHDPKIAELEKELKRHMNKTICDQCKGKGRIIEHFPTITSNSSCCKCNGEGFIY